MPSQQSAVASLSCGVSDHELAALVVLIRLKASTTVELAARLEEYGSAVAVLRRVESESQLAPLFSVNEVDEARASVKEWRERDLDVRAVFDRNYPRNLLTIFNKPPLLFVRGTWNEDLDGVSVAVVGTRKASPEGLRRAAHAARKIAKAGITVLSGLAAGIDTAAHAAALDAGGRTAAVMGTGIGRIYPTENRALAERIVSAGGALLSQFLPDQAPTQWTFPMRNVVMSGLSLATLVIEAGATSGAKSQARHALEHGRTVFLPKTLVEEHEWANRMVTTGAHGVRAIQVDSADEVVERVFGAVTESALAV